VHAPALVYAITGVDEFAIEHTAVLPEDETAYVIAPLPEVVATDDAVKVGDAGVTVKVVVGDHVIVCDARATVNVTAIETAAYVGVAAAVAVTTQLPTAV
jgi:hypothetical protein